MKKSKKIAIIGGGAAGTAAAWSLARSRSTTKTSSSSTDDVDPDFAITLIEACDVLGGVACTKYMDGQQQSQFINYGVQGGAPASHRNIIAFLKEFGEDVDDASLSVSFGKGQYHWTNYQDSELQHRLKDDIKKFGTLLKWVSRLELLTLFLSIDTVMKWTNLSQEFRERMVYPLVALFFGTGNQTPNMSAAIVARVFTDPSLKIFEYSEDRLIDSEPTNFAFRNLDLFYNGKVRPYLEERGVRVLTGHKVESIIERDTRNGVSLRISKVSKDRSEYRAGGDQTVLNDPTGSVTDQQHATATTEAVNDDGSWREQFDDIVLACPANVSYELLGDHATFWERRVLGRVEYFHDLSVTHCDESYMKKNFEVDGKAIYFIKTYKEEPKLLEMGFDLSGYQSSIFGGVQFRSEKHDEQQQQRVYQTIFLDQKRQSDLWPIKDIDESKIVDRTWWSAFAHTMNHFRRVIPFVGLLHRQSTVNQTHTYYAGSWMLINTHDIAVASGLAVADRLGAPYPFADNQLAFDAYKTFWVVGHGMNRRS